MQHVSCPGCGSDTSNETDFIKHGFTYKNCSVCDSIYASPRPSQGELNRYYYASSSQKYWSEVLLHQTQDIRLQQIARPALLRVQEIANEFLPNGVPRIIDVGASNGLFLTEWKRNNPNSKLIAIEPGKSPANECRQRGIEVYECAVEKLAKIFNWMETL